MTLSIGTKAPEAATQKQQANAIAKKEANGKVINLLDENQLSGPQPNGYGTGFTPCSWGGSDDNILELIKDSVYTIAYHLSVVGSSFTNLLNSGDDIDGSIELYNGDYLDTYYQSASNNWYYARFTPGTSSQVRKIIFSGTNDSEIDKAMVYYGTAIPSDANYAPYSSDRVGPIFSGGSKNCQVNVNSKVAVNTFKSALTAYDETDGDVTASITLKSDTYTPNWNKLGTWAMVFTASDSSGNVCEFTFNITVVDQDAPSIVGPDSIEVEYNKVITMDALKLKYSATDNYDTSLTITVKTDGYTSKKTELGNKTVVLSVIDSSGNEATKSVIVKVVDKTAPVITGPATLTKFNNLIVSTQDLLALFSATDEKSGSCGVSVYQDNYTTKGNIVGSYDFIVKATDASGNSATKKLVITVSDKIAPVIYVDATFIYLSENVAISEAQILNLLIQENEINVNSLSSVSLSFEDGFELDSKNNEVGVYKMTVNVRSVNGVEQTLEKEIEVLETDNGTQITPDNAFDKFLIQFKAFFKSFWQTILDIVDHVAKFFGSEDLFDTPYSWLNKK